MATEQNIALDPIQRELFGEFPRPVGNPRQWFVHGESEMDIFLKRNQGENNIYSSISWFTNDGVPVTDKVAIDLDTPVKEVAFPETEAEDEKIRLMRNNPDRANEVLGLVCDDATKIGEYCEEKNIPVVGVYTGFGIHIHLLYQPESNPQEELSTTVHKLVDDLDLKTVDRKPIGDLSRLMRIPNCQRVEDGRSCGLWTIPLEVDELIDLGPMDLLELSSQPRKIDRPDESRPEMEVYDDYYTNPNESGETTAQQPLDVDIDQVDVEGMKQLLKDILKMPCMWQRLFQNDPGHLVRMNAAVMLFNYGFNVEDVFGFFRQLNWNDWDPETTRTQLKQIRSRGYADMSCKKLREQGLCVMDHDELKSCETYGWSGGNQHYLE